jgi:1-acyl-sn-glycerol-3-phosphate acyltransferase
MIGTARQWLGSVAFTVFLFVSAGVWGLVVVATGPFGHAVSYRVVGYWATWIMAALRILCGLKVQVSGLENLPKGSAVVLMKHSSAWETIAQLKILPVQTWVMKRELLWMPIVGWVFMVLKPIAINRSAGRSAVQQVIALGKQRLAAGLWVVIFPEGTRVPAGEVRRFGLSGALLAIQAGVPVVPIAHNSGEFWPRHGWLKRPGTVQMVIGKPIPTEGREARELTEEVRVWIEQQLARMSTGERADGSAG